MKKFAFALMLAAVALGTIPVLMSEPAKAECKYTQNSGRAAWSC